jgi:hypothetical protein
VKIEVGGRSDTDPTDTPTMRAYLAETSPDLAECSPFSVRTVGPERTFWEKAMLLHEEAHRAGGAGPKLRMSRHYYDLHCLIDRLIKRGTAKDAVVDLKLFKAIADHRAVYFKRSKEAQATLKPGTLRLRPADGSLGLWKSDYEKMSEVMFWGDPPSFEEIIATVEEFETSFNREAGSSTAG